MKSDNVSETQTMLAVPAEDEAHPVVKPVEKNNRKNPKAAEKIAGVLRRQIVTGAIKTDEKLLSERELQEQFEVSRPTLREAMRLLESESLIKILRGQQGGARVQKLDIGVTTRQVGMYLQMEGTTLADVAQARSFLEPPAARLLAKNPSPSVIAKLRANVAAAKRAFEEHDPVALVDAQTQFSEVLTHQEHNKTLSLLATLLHDIVHMQLMLFNVQSHSREGVQKMQWLNIRGREKLIDLIEAGKADEAESFWRYHLDNSTKVLLSSYRAQMPIDVLNDLNHPAVEQPD